MKHNFGEKLLFYKLHTCSTADSSQRIWGWIVCERKRLKAWFTIYITRCVATGSYSFSMGFGRVAKQEWNSILFLRHDMSEAIEKMMTSGCDASHATRLNYGLLIMSVVNTVRSTHTRTKSFRKNKQQLHV